MVLPGMALGFAVITVISRCIGAGDYEQARYFTKKLLKITYLSMLVTNILVVVAMPVIVKLYNLSEVASTIAMQIILSHGIAAILIWPLAFTLPNTLRAANDVKFSMVISILSMWIFRIGFGYLLAKYLGMGVMGVWFAMYIDWAVRAICFVLRYRSTRWHEFLQ